MTQEDGSGRKAKDSDVKVKRWRIKEEEEDKRRDSWQGGRWKRIQSQAWSASRHQCDRPHPPSGGIASSCCCSRLLHQQLRPETDYLLHLQRTESDGHYQLMWRQIGRATNDLKRTWRKICVREQGVCPLELIAINPSSSLLSLP